MRSTPTAKSLDHGQAEGRRQPGRSDHRHRAAEGRVSQHAICSSGPGQFVNVRLLIDTLKQVVIVPTPPCSAAPTARSSMSSRPTTEVTVRPVTRRAADDEPTPWSPRREADRAASSPPASRGCRTARASPWHAPTTRSREPRSEADPGRRRPAREPARPAAEAPRRNRLRLTHRAAHGKPRRARRGDGKRGDRKRRARHERRAMSVSAPFIRRPIATSLLGARGDARRLARLSAGCPSRRCRRSISRPSR